MPLLRHRNPVVRLWARMVTLAEQRPEARALHRLNATSDETLLARGVTRSDEIRRILGPRHFC